jgi:hypothetical protein
MVSTMAKSFKSLLVICEFPPVCLNSAHSEPPALVSVLKR